MSLEVLEDRSLLSVAPLPIPGGIPNPFPGEPFLHVNLIGPADSPPPVGNDPSTITDLAGLVGEARVQATGTDGDGHTLFWDVDLRFMQGLYKGVDGGEHFGTFVLVWLDTYPSRSDFIAGTNQSHDFNLGFGAPVDAMGDVTLWTGAVPAGDVQVTNLGAGRAEMHVHGLAATDYFSIANQFDDGGLQGEAAATVSFDVVWGGPVSRQVAVSDPADGFAGIYVENQATVTWSASNENGFSFTAAPGNFSTSVPGDAFAELGAEINGLTVPVGPSLARPPAGSADNSARDLAFALLALEGGDKAVLPASGTLAPGLALSNLPDHVGPGEGQPLLIGGMKDGLSGDSAAKAAAAASTVQERAFGSASDPAATPTAPFAEVGQQGEDPLFR